MITTHTSLALLQGVADEVRLTKALHWAIVRHPMLRAAVVEPSVRAKDTGGRLFGSVVMLWSESDMVSLPGPFFHGGQDGRRGADM